MSYYRPSFAQSTGMSRGSSSRGFSSRGSSYRGSSSRGSNSWNSSINRGGYHSSRGGSSSAPYRSSGGGGYSSNFDNSRAIGHKYSGERMTSSFRGGGDGEYRSSKPYRPDTGYSRDSRLSPERKRMRTESRHDVYGGGDSSMSSRYPDDRRSSMQESFGRTKLTSSSPFHRPSSASGVGDFRKPLAPPPPPNISNAYNTGNSTRSGYRGGRIASRNRYIVSSRDSARSSIRPPPRRLMDYSTSSTSTWRTSSRGGSSIRSSEYARRLRLRQLTNRSRPPLPSSRIKSRNDSDDELWGAVRDDDDDEEEEEEEEEAEDDDVDDDEKDTSKESKVAKEIEEDDDTVVEKKVAIDPEEKADAVDKEGGEDADEEGEKKEGDSGGDAATTVVIKKKSPTKKVSSSKEREREVSPEIPHRKQFIKLVCPYCHTRCITFARYNMHLRSARHSAAMHHVALKQKSVLSKMRISQRAEQKSIERSSDETELTAHTNFCPLCKLNYRQTKLIHRASKAHKDMKRFLMPFCKVCGITCKSPMLYETHCCSLEHIKRKAYSTTNGDKSDKSEHSGDDLQNYMTIDSVGDMDDIDMELAPPGPLEVKEVSAGGDTTDGDVKSARVKSDKDKRSASLKREREPQINVGVENIRKIEVHYCDLCRMYLPRVEDGHDDLDRILSKHCKQRTHMQRYIRYKEDMDLAKRAERLQRREMAEKEKEKDAKKAASTPSKDDSNKTADSTPTKPDATKDPQESASALNEQDISLTDTTEGGDVTNADAGDDDDAEESKLLADGEEEENHHVDEEQVKEIQEADEAEAGDDKLWEDVDKDLGDILAGENKSCDEEEEDDDSVVNGERYDRFKYSEKNVKTGTPAKTASTPTAKAVAAKKAAAKGDGGGEKSKVEAEAAK